MQGEIYFSHVKVPFSYSLGSHAGAREKWLDNAFLLFNYNSWSVFFYFFSSRKTYRIHIHILSLKHCQGLISHGRRRHVVGSSIGGVGHRRDLAPCRECRAPSEAAEIELTFH